MADVTINELTRGVPAGGNVLPYSTGANTLSVPVSAIFQDGCVVGIGTAAPLMPNEGYAVKSGLEIYNNVTAGVKLTTQKGHSFIRFADNNVSSNLIIDADRGSTSSGNTELRLDIRQNNIIKLQTNKVTITQPLEVTGDVKATGYKTGSLPMFGANAFVHFHGGQDVNGNASTANTERRIYAGGNVSSVVRNATGLYTIYFNTAMTSTEYMAVCSARHRDGVTFITHSEVRNRLTTSCVVGLQSNPGGVEGSVAYDSRDVDVMIIC